AWSGEPEHLPERKVPGHHREDDAERLVTDEALACVGGGRLVGEEPLRVLGVVAADPGAPLRFGYPRADRLSHLERHEAAPVGLLRLEHFRSAPEKSGSRAVRRLAPGTKSQPGITQTLLERLG